MFFALLQTVGLGDDIRRPCIISEMLKEGNGWSVEQR